MTLKVINITGEFEPVNPFESRYLRQLGILSPEEYLDKKIVLIGAGGIGSHVAHELARMGISFNVFDHDDVEDHNLSNQLGYQERDLGFKKTEALLLSMPDYCVNNNNYIALFWQGQQCEEIVISGVDSMNAREEIWQYIKNNPTVKLYIDARMGGEVYQVFAIDPCNAAHIAKYEETLGRVVDPDPCTERAIAYNLFGVASKIGKVVQCYLRGKKFSNSIYEDIRGVELGRSLLFYEKW